MLAGAGPWRTFVLPLPSPHPWTCGRSPCLWLAALPWARVLECPRQQCGGAVPSVPATVAALAKVSFSKPAVWRGGPGTPLLTAGGALGAQPAQLPCLPMATAVEPAGGWEKGSWIYRPGHRVRKTLWGVVWASGPPAHLSCLEPRNGGWGRPEGPAPMQAVTRRPGRNRLTSSSGHLGGCAAPMPPFPKGPCLVL